MTAPLGTIGELEFLIKLQRILSEGVFTASYKYALLLALAELSVERSADSDGTLRIELRELAERFITLYWRQASPFAGANLLAQNPGKQASIVNKISAFKVSAPTLSVARRHTDWRKLVAETQKVVVGQPLWKLQRVGDSVLDFLYTRQPNQRHITLNPGVAACFRSQFVMVQALVQQGWLSIVQRLNGQTLGLSGDLSTFLFGNERTALLDIAAGLRDLQKGVCFYCRGRLKEMGEVDHFIPWSRYPLDSGHNFVLTHAACNGDKGDMLAATGHLEEWVKRNDAENKALAAIFAAARFPFDLDASFSVALWAYESAEKANALLWARRTRETARLAQGWKELFR